MEKKDKNCMKLSIHLRMKNLTAGNKPLYLDVCLNGRHSHFSLNLYLIPEHSNSDREANRVTIEAASFLRARKAAELYRDGLWENNEPDRMEFTLVEWMRYYSRNRRERGRSHEYSLQIEKSARYIERYSGADVMLDEVDKDFCLGFIAYLRSTDLSEYSMHDYFRCFKASLNMAVREGLIASNPVALIPVEDRLKCPESHREFLTIPELKTLANADCRNNMVKRAYLFSCLCGLRLSDIKLLRWENLYCDGEQWRVSIVVKKTQRPLYIPISQHAMEWLPERREGQPDNAPVFSLPSNTDAILRKWAKENGICKRVTFHTARHTFATMMLTVGSDIYTVSKLLGHTKVSTTQIYAKVVDRKKDEAVSMIPDIRI